MHVQPPIIERQTRRKNVMRVFALSRDSSQEEDRRSLNRNTSQGSSSPRTSINIDSVMSYVRMWHRCVAVHHEPFVASRRVEELVANPDKIVNILLLDRHVRPNAGVYEQEIAATELVAQ